MADTEQANMALINTLPERLASIVHSTQTKMDTGVTLNMNEVIAERIAALKSMWLELATKYPKGAFGKGDHGAYFDRVVDARRDLYLALAEPEGPGTGGTIVGLTVGSQIYDDGKSIVAATASALLSMETPSSFWDDWNKRWAAAG